MRRLPRSLVEDGWVPTHDYPSTAQRERIMKKKKRLLVPAVVAIPVLVAAQPPSVAGKWEVNANVGGTASYMECTFTQKDAELSGNCEGEQGPRAITGKVDGKSVVWQFNTQWEGQTLTVYYKGTLQTAEKITGSVDVQPLSVSGEFTATRPK
jgi:hypothetical protein